MSKRAFYRTEDGQHDFGFDFKEKADFIEIYCFQRPELDGRPDDVVKHHLYRSGKVCFVEGREPKTMHRAMELAKQFAEHYLEYVKTGEYSA